MKDDYNKELDKIKAPRDLIERTKVEMRKELAKQVAETKQEIEPIKNIMTDTPETVKLDKAPVINIRFRQLVIVSAAVIILIMATLGYVNSRNVITIQAVTETTMTLNPNLGRMTEKGSKSQDTIKVISGKDPSIIPEFLKEVKKSKIKGQSIQLAFDKKGVYHAAYELEGTYYYVTGIDVTEREFIDFFKNKF